MNDTALPRYRFLSGFDFCVVDYELYCYPWLPCSKKRVRAVLRHFHNKKAAITGGGIPRLYSICAIDGPSLPHENNR